MSADRTLDNWSLKMGWNIDSCLGLTLEYIERQGSNDAFEDFLAQQAALEDTAGIIVEDIPWTCPDCGASNTDNPYLTDFLICVGCSMEFEWADIVSQLAG